MTEILIYQLQRQPLERVLPALIEKSVERAWRETEAGGQPILLTLGGDNPNGAAVRFLIDGAPMPADAESYQRIVLLVDGEDPDAVAAARARWSEGKAKGLD